MKQSKHVSDLHSRIDDVMDTLRAVKGDTFADCAYCPFLGAHTMKLVNTVLKQVDDNVQHVVGKQFAFMLSATMSTLAEQAKLSEADCQELIKWTDTLLGHVETALEEARS